MTSQERTPEAELLDRHAGGDEHALDALVGAYQEPGFWVARHLLGDDDLAYDVVQDAFFRVLRDPARYDGQRAFKPWFCQIVRNLAIDRLRRRRAQAAPETLEALPARKEAPRLENRELGECIREVLSRLPDAQRELITLRDVEGWGADEIAELHGADHGTTRWRLHQARKQFRTIWVSLFGEDSV